MGTIEALHLSDASPEWRLLHTNPMLAPACLLTVLQLDSRLFLFGGAHASHMYSFSMEGELLEDFSGLEGIPGERGPAVIRNSLLYTYTRRRDWGPPFWRVTSFDGKRWV